MTPGSRSTKCSGRSAGPFRRRPPGLTFRSLPSLALPFLTFICALVLFQRGRRSAVSLACARPISARPMRRLAFCRRRSFQNSFSSKRSADYLWLADRHLRQHCNNAGTFFGIAFLLNLGLCFHQLRKIQAGSFTKRIQEFRHRLARQEWAAADPRPLLPRRRRRAVPHSIARGRWRDFLRFGCRGGSAACNLGS